MSGRWFGKWARGGEPVARVGVMFTLTREDAAGLLLARLMPGTAAEAGELTAAAVERAVREQLAVSRDAGYWWADEYAEGYDRELTWEEAWAWALRQAGKL